MPQSAIRWIWAYSSELFRKSQSTSTPAVLPALPETTLVILRTLGSTGSTSARLHAGARTMRTTRTRTITNILLMFFIFHLLLFWERLNFHTTLIILLSNPKVKNLKPRIKCGDLSLSLLKNLKIKEGSVPLFFIVIS